MTLPSPARSLKSARLPSGLTIALAASLALGLTACGKAPDTTNPAANAEGQAASKPSEADAFAQRIKASSKANQAASKPQPPQIAQPLEGAAPGPFVAGTATDPESKTCAANRMGPYLNQPADDATRAAIMKEAEAAKEVRFIAPGSDFIRPDPTHPRLNIMIDVTGVIRDARCG